MSESDQPRRLDADRLGVLAAAAQALHGERDLATALLWARRAARHATGLPEAGICLLPRHGSPTWAVQDGRVNFALLGDPRTNDLIAAGLDSGSPKVFSDLADAEAALPPEDRLRRTVPLSTLVVVPIMSRDGLPQAALLVGDVDPVAITPDDVDALAALAAHVGVALDNSANLARMEEVEARGKEVVHALQEAVRPPAPVVPYTELGVHYVAADPSAPTGGDLYDWMVLPDGHLHLAVVDVMGKGVEATKHALAVTHALRLLAVEGAPLSDIVSRADALVTVQNAELVATLLLGRYDPESGHLWLAGAGHPPALVVHSGEVREVSAPGIPIGWPGAGSSEVVELTLERSDTLIIYTDGLIEATKDILKGLADLASAAAATASYPATSLARALVERQLADAARHDDSLALVLRRRSPAPSLPSHVLAPFTHHFSPQAAAVPIARHLLRDWLQQVPVEVAAVDSLLLVVSELCSNAVRHASGDAGSVGLHAWVDGDSVRIEVSDDGSGLTWSEHAATDLPDPEAEQGRGLFLVREFADSVTTAQDDGRTVVQVSKHAVVGVDLSATIATA
jgi:anti-sigma regulatory factor (Ser/Thr protein kinase)